MTDVSMAAVTLTAPGEARQMVRLASRLAAAEVVFARAHSLLTTFAALESCRKFASGGEILRISLPSGASAPWPTHRDKAPLPHPPTVVSFTEVTPPWSY